MRRQMGQNRRETPQMRRVAFMTVQTDERWRIHRPYPYHYCYGKFPSKLIFLLYNSIFVSHWYLYCMRIFIPKVHPSISAASPITALHFSLTHIPVPDPLLPIHSIPNIILCTMSLEPRVYFPAKSYMYTNPNLCTLYTSVMIALSYRRIL